MARAQTVKKKGRSSSSAKRGKGRTTGGGVGKARTAARARRPTARRMTGSKGKGRYAQRGGRTRSNEGETDVTDNGDRSRSWTNEDTGVKPEGSMPPTLVSGDATVAEQRRAASGQPDGARTNRPSNQADGKPGARGGGPVDRQAAAGDVEARSRRVASGDALETGRQDLTEPTRESTRGPEPRGGQEGRAARARRAGLGFRDED